MKANDAASALAALEVEINAVNAAYTDLMLRFNDLKEVVYGQDLDLSEDACEHKAEIIPLHGGGDE